MAQSIIDQQADEVVAMIGSAARRLHLLRRDADVVLGGGLVHAGDGSFLRRIEAGVAALIPAARMRPLRVLPVVGAALLGLDRLATSAEGPGVAPGAGDRLRRTLTRERLVTTQEA